VNEDSKRGLITSDLALELCGNEGLEFKGRKFVPDETKAYFQFTLSHGFPVATVYGTGIHPNVVALSHKSLIEQNINYEHQIAHYYAEPGKENHVRDAVIGSVVAVDFPSASAGGFRINKDPTKTVGINGVGVLWKQMQRMKTLLGEHQTSRHHWTVSMEVQYLFSESGFAVHMGKKAEFEGSPQDMIDAGYEYVSWKDAPEEMRATFSKKKNRRVAMYKGRNPVLLMGGLDKPVHYAGVAVVRYGAEPTADITRLAASKTADLAVPFQNLAQLFAQALSK